jgi:O-antigen/teichoic acid export membrane protein
MAISIINTAKNSLKFTSVQIISALITIPVNIYIATVLVPEEYGNYGFLVLWLTYATLIGPGITVAGYREVPVLLGKGEDEQALRIQNISITSDLLYSILPFLVLLVASFFYTEDVLRVGLVIIAVSYAISHVAGYWSGVSFMRQNFNVAATGRLIIGVATPLIMLACVNWLNVYALLIAPIGAAAIAWLYYWRKGPIHFRFTFDRSETLRLIKTGIVLQGVTLVLWGFRLADRTIIASMLPTDQLGLYVYAMGFVMMALLALEDFGNVLQPILYKEAGKAKSIYEGFKDTKRISVYMALASALLIPLCQLVFFLVVTVITKNYAGSIPIFYVLSYSIFLF